MYRFCSNNVLYTESLSIMSIFSNSFWYKILLSFRLKSQAGVACKSVFYKKVCNVILQSCKYEELTFHHEFFFFISLGQYCQKMLSKVEGLKKKGRSSLWGGGGRGDIYWRGVHTFCTCILNTFLKNYSNVKLLNILLYESEDFCCNMNIEIMKAAIKFLKKIWTLHWPHLLTAHKNVCPNGIYFSDTF